MPDAAPRSLWLKREAVAVANTIEVLERRQRLAARTVAMALDETSTNAQPPQREARHRGRSNFNFYVSDRARSRGPIA